MHKYSWDLCLHIIDIETKSRYLHKYEVKNGILKRSQANLSTWTKVLPTIQIKIVKPIIPKKQGTDNQNQNGWTHFLKM